MESCFPYLQKEKVLPNTSVAKRINIPSRGNRT
jgi:hypothetical protein